MDGAAGSAVSEETVRIQNSQRLFAFNRASQLRALFIFFKRLKKVEAGRGRNHWDGSLKEYLPPKILILSPQRWT